MRFRLCLAALIVVGLLAQSASAVLDRYTVRNFSVADFAITVPKTQIRSNSEPGDGASQGDESTVVVDRAGPTLKKLVIVQVGASTFFVDVFNGFIWFASNWRDGPKGEFTAISGSINASNEGVVDWGTLTAWAITGATFCNANPALVCGLGVASQLVSTDPVVRSAFYDTGDWTFHGTGFRANPFVFFTSTLGGNSSIVLKGSLAPNASVPALPLLGIGALAASLFTMGVAVLRRKGR